MSELVSALTPYRDLQAIAKSRGIKANLKKTDLLSALTNEADSDNDKENPAPVAVAPKSAQKAPKSAQKVPKSAQKAPKSALKSSQVAFADDADPAVEDGGNTPAVSKAAAATVTEFPATPASAGVYSIGVEGLHSGASSIASATLGWPSDEAEPAAYDPDAYDPDAVVETLATQFGTVSVLDLEDEEEGRDPAQRVGDAELKGLPPPSGSHKRF
jgi:hypothetical protein